MDNKETIIQAAIELINEKGEQINNITVREICKKANVGLGLLNYHFGNKDNLIELCVERIINGIVDKLHSIQENIAELSAFEKLVYLGNITFTFLFEHYAISRISILSDMRTPKENDNTSRTRLAYMPHIAACRPDWDSKTIERKAFYLITIIQHSFLRHKVIKEIYGVDLTVSKERETFHEAILHDILEV